jgi:uncharacterized membrane protein
LGNLNTELAPVILRSQRTIAGKDRERALTRQQVSAQTPWQQQANG